MEDALPTDWVLPAGAAPLRETNPVAWRYLSRLGLLGPRPVLVDVGANVGRSVITAIEQGYFSRGVAIEPHPDTFQCLEANLARHQLSDRVRAVQCAVSDVDGEGRLHSDTKHTNRRLESPLRPPAKTALPISTRRLDSIVDATGDVNAVKVDVQGWEARVLAGAERLLADPAIVWILEVSPAHLAAAGTPLVDLLALCARWFTHALDLRRKPEPAMTIDETAARLAYLAGKAHTDVVFFRK